MSFTYRYVIRQQFTKDELDHIPSGYLLVEDGKGYVHLRNALLFVKDHNLIHRFRTPTFNDRLKRWSKNEKESMEDMYPAMLRTMKFDQWTSFVVSRHIDKAPGPAYWNFTHLRMAQPQWLTYFCFANERDAALFKIAWQ